MRALKLSYTFFLIVLSIRLSFSQSPQTSNLLTSYLPATMQALAYYIDQLQYEPLSTTTVEPPFKVDDQSVVEQALSQTPISSTATTARPIVNGSYGIWTPPVWWGALTTSTSKPTITRTSTSATTTTKNTTKKPTIWGQPSISSTTTPPTISKPTSWWNYSTTTKQTGTTITKTTTSKPTIWYSSSMTTTRKPTTSWWSYSTSINRQPTSPPTLSHRPGIYAPLHASHQQNKQQQPEKLEGYDVFNEIGDNPEGFDKLTLALIRDIQTETDHDQFTNDFESLDNFLRLYDDNYGRATFDAESAMDRWSSTSTAGKKRIPPTKPYVEFLLVYDLLKRDAKAGNLSKYEGYSPEIMQELHELSSASAERQLYTLFKRMLDRGDIQRSDVISRIQSILKDLGNPDSITSKSLHFIPALPFIL